MIRRLVDFALGNRLLVLAMALMLFAGGIVAFHDLPIEAYPDVADNYVDIVPLKLPAEIPYLAPSQEWRTVWDSALDRKQLGESIASRFAGGLCFARNSEPAVVTTPLISIRSLTASRSFLLSFGTGQYAINA